MNYEDIIGLPHHVSQRHPHMPVSDRAAQFAPFAALTGYGDVIKETARQTEERPELSEDEMEILNYKLRLSWSKTGDHDYLFCARSKKIRRSVPESSGEDQEGG